MSTPAHGPPSDVIDGVRHRPLEMHHNYRGSFTEVFSHHWGLPFEAVKGSKRDYREIIRIVAGSYRALSAGCQVPGFFTLR